MGPNKIVMLQNINIIGKNWKFNSLSLVFYLISALRAHLGMSPILDFSKKGVKKVPHWRRNIFCEHVKFLEPVVPGGAQTKILDKSVTPIPTYSALKTFRGSHVSI